LTSDSPRAGTVAEPASQTADRVDQPGEHALPLLRLSGWEADKLPIRPAYFTGVHRTLGQYSHRRVA
jgi:hypothetical protein